MAQSRYKTNELAKINAEIKEEPNKDRFDALNVNKRYVDGIVSRLPIFWFSFLLLWRYCHLAEISQLETEISHLETKLDHLRLYSFSFFHFILKFSYSNFQLFRSLFKETIWLKNIIDSIDPEEFLNLPVPLGFGQHYSYEGQDQMISEWKKWFKDYSAFSQSSTDRNSSKIPFISGLSGIGL